MKGVYHLLIELPESVNIRVGGLGLINFEKGHYVYTGSALNNMEKRVARHRSSEKKLRWHIDYLLEHGPVIDVKLIETLDKAEECRANGRIGMISRGCVTRFGSSDCKCRSHLHHFRNKPSF